MSTFTNVLRYVGDLDDEFYDDERQRDVWNEASAIGFQLFYWVSLIGAAVLPWTVGITGSWIALGILVVFLTISSLILAYSKARGLDMYAAQSLLQPRVVLGVVLYLVAAFSSLITLAMEYLGGGGSAVFVGMAVGAVVGGACGLYGLLRSRRLQRADEARADEAEKLELAEGQA